MTTQTIISRDTLHSLFTPGDAAINFTAESFSGADFVVKSSAGPSATLAEGIAYPCTDAPTAEDLQLLLENEVKRFVIVADDAQKTVQLAAALQQLNIPHVVFLIEEYCNADAFMDEDDSDAVAERLRQLGYI